MGGKSESILAVSSWLVSCLGREAISELLRAELEPDREGAPVLLRYCEMR